MRRSFILVFIFLIFIAACSSEVEETPQPVLDAWVDLPIDRQSIEFIDPVVIIFSMPMDPESSTKPLEFSPNISGSFTWSNNNTELTFVPKSYFPESGLTYQVGLDPNLISQSGVEFSFPPSFKIWVKSATTAFRSIITKILSYENPRMGINFYYGYQQGLEEHILVEPAVDYSIEWETNRMEIVLEEGRIPEQVYTVSLLPGAVTDDGKALKPDSRKFSFEPLEVSIRREIAHSRLDPFQFAFNYPVDRDSFQDAISIEPAFEYSLEWLGDQELLLHPTEPLTPGEEVEFSVSDGLTSETGVALPRKYTYAYSTPTVLRNVGTRAGTDGYLVFYLDFEIEPDLDSLEELIQIEPAVAFSTEWDPENYLFEIHSDHRVLADQKYTLTILGEIPDAEGFPIELSVVQPTETATLVLNIPDQEELESYRYDELKPREPMIIEFDRPMDWASTEAAFSMQPDAEYSFRWIRSDKLEIFPQTFFPEGQIVEFTINAGALDQNGNPVLAADFSWKDRFEYLDDAVSFGSGANVQLVDTEGYRTIDVGLPDMYRTDDFESITVELLRVTEQQFTEYIEFTRDWGRDYGQSRIFDTSAYATQASWEVTEEQLDAVFGEEGHWGLILPEYVPDGLYIANLITDHVNDQIAIVASSASVTAKVGESRNGAGQIVAWVNNINSYMYQEADIRVFDRGGVLLASGKTNEIGVFEGTYNLDYVPFIVVAQKDRMYSLTGIWSDWEYNYDFWDFWRDFFYTQDIENYLVYTYTDRPIYRPGQTVNYKSIIRLDYDVDYSLPSTGKQVEVRLRDARGNLVETQQAVISPFGSIEGSFLINPGSMLGKYKLQVELDGEIHDQEFKVQEYSKPDYSVNVSTDSAEYVAGDQVAIQIDTQYLFGEPVINAEVKVNLYELAFSRYRYNVYDEEIDLDDIEGYDWYETSFEEMHGSTDENGILTLELTAPTGRFSNGWYVYDYYNSYYSNETRMYSSRFAVEAVVEDGSDQVVSGIAPIKIYTTSADLRLSLEWAAEAGDSFPVTVGLESLFGMDLAEQAISLEVSKWERRENSSWGDYETYLELELVSDQEGRVTEYLNLESGWYRIEASGEDDRGNLLKKRRYTYILGEDTNLSENFIDGISLSAKRTDYTAGETAEVMIETPISGEGLLTIERGGVLNYRVVRVEPPYTIIEVPLYSSYAPNVFINFQLWEEIDVLAINPDAYYYIVSSAESKLRSGVLGLNVVDVNHELQIEISSDKEIYQPGEEATFYIEVNDAAGSPVNTEVSLALVDEAIYLLSQDLVEPIHEAFFSPREHGVSSYNSLEPYRYIIPPQMGGGGGGDDYMGDGADPRSDFPDTLIWLPRLITEEDGRLRVTVTLPDSLTTWRVSVKGVTLDTEVGEAAHTVITQQPVVVRPQLPQQLIVGDTFVLSAVVHNYTAEALNFVAYADCSICDFTGDLSHRVAVEPGESEVVNWQADVVEAGESDVVISVEAGEYGDAVQTTVTAAPRSISSWVSESGSFEGKVEIPIDLPDDALPGSQLVIKLDRTISSSLLDGVEYLTGFPYGCIEQTMSRALPNAVVSRAFNQLGVSERAGLADLDAKIQASIQRLYAFQHDDGGWGWWYDDSSNNYNTAWVVFGLQVTAESGYFIDPGVIERGTSYLAENLAEMNADTQSFALYAMSLGGGAELDDVLSLTSSFVDLNTFSQSALILTLDQLGEEELALELLLSIVDDLETDSLGRQYIPGRSKDGYYDKKYMSSSVRSNALLLKAILTVHPDHGSASGIADWLMSKRRSNSGWGTTNETAFSMIALTDYIAHEQTAGKVFTYSISLNGTEYSTAQFAAGENSEVINIPAAKLAEGENQVVITSDSAQALYYVVGRELVSETLPEDVEGIMVKRTYHHPETKKELTTFSEGDLVMIQITVNIPTDAFYIIIEDPLPGGLIALNENLALTSHAASADPYAAATRYRWHILGYNYKEIYPDKVVFFITELADGYYTYQYYARAVVAGEFISPPTHLSAMYDEDFYGYGEEIILEVQD